MFAGKLSDYSIFYTQVLKMSSKREGLPFRCPHVLPYSDTSDIKKFLTKREVLRYDSNPKPLCFFLSSCPRITGK